MRILGFRGGKVEGSSRATSFAVDQSRFAVDQSVEFWPVARTVGEIAEEARRRAPELKIKKSVVRRELRKLVADGEVERRRYKGKTVYGRPFDGPLDNGEGRGFD